MLPLAHTGLTPPAVAGPGCNEWLGLTSLLLCTLLADSLTLVTALLPGRAVSCLLLPVAVETVQAVAEPVEASCVLAIARYVARRVTRSKLGSSLG